MSTVAPWSVVQLLLVIRETLNVRSRRAPCLSLRISERLSFNYGRLGCISKANFEDASCWREMLAQMPRGFQHLHPGVYDRMISRELNMNSIHCIVLRSLFDSASIDESFVEIVKKRCGNYVFLRMTDS